MRTPRRGLTVIGLVLILIAIGILVWVALRVLTRAEPAADVLPAPAIDTSATTVTAPGAPLVARLGLLAPLDTTAGVGDTVLVRVRATDAANAGVANTSVVFTVAEGGGAVLPATATTNDLGEAEARWVLGAAAGRQVLQASVPDQPAASATVTVLAAEAR